MVSKFNKRIKICHIVSVDITARFLLMDQLSFLAAKGFDVCLVCSPGKWKKEIESAGITVKNIKITRKMTPLADLISLIKLAIYLRKERFDIVHTHTPKPGLLGQLAARMAGVPIIINTIHGLYFSKQTPGFKKNFFIIIEKIAARCSDLIFSQNREDILTLINRRIAKPEIIKYLGNGIDIKKFDKKRFSKDFIIKKKKDLGIDSEFYIVGTVGRLVKEKGYLDLFESFKRVLVDFPKTKLLVVGPEDLEKKDAFDPKIVKKYGIENNVIFLGERTDLDELYPLMDVFVLASHREGFPRTIIEAMACSTPVVATNIRGCNETIDNNENGILVDYKNPSSLSGALILLLKDRFLAEALAKKAREKAEKFFDESMIFDKIYKEYLRLLKEKQINGKSEKKKYLITGGAGFIGTSLANALVAEGNDVVVVDNFSNNSGQAIDKRIKTYKLNVSNSRLSEVFSNERPNIIYHLAGPIGLRKEKTDPVFIASLDYLNNLINILNNSIDVGVEKIIFLSSGGALYSGAKIIPTPESYEVHPESAYGLANIEMGELLKKYKKENNLDYVILRFSNVYGPYQWGDGVIPSFINQILKDKEVLINGSGNQTRDFLYIDDAVSALLGARRLNNGIWNVGSGAEISLNELVEKISKIIKVKIKIIHNEKREQTNRSCLDVSKIKMDLGWEPKISIEDGLKRIIDHYVNRV